MKTVSDPRIVEAMRLVLSWVRSVLNRRPSERKIRISPSMFVRKYEYMLTVIWYPHAVKNAAHAAAVGLR